MQSDTSGQAIELADASPGAAQAGVWDTALPGEALLPILGRLDRVGLHSVEVLCASVMDACVRTLREDPWLRLRLAAERLQRTDVSVWTRGVYGFGARPLPAQVSAALARRLAANGATRHVVHDPLNDVERLTPVIEDTKASGMSACVALVYAADDAYVPNYFAERARQAVEAGADAVCLFDPAGVLRPDAAMPILRAMRTAGCPLELRTAGSSGEAEITCLRAVEHRLVDVLHGASLPVAGRDAYPPLDYLVEHLGRQGMQLRIARQEAAAISDYFAAVGARLRLPTGEHCLHDPQRLRHQIPRHLERAHEEWLMLDPSDGRYEVWLEAVATLRGRLGRPPMAAPIAELICEQACRQISAGEGAELAGGIAHLALGHYGRLTDEVDPELRARAEALPREDSPVRGQDLDVVADSDDALTRAFYPKEVCAPFFATRDAASKRLRGAVDARDPLTQLMGELERFPHLRSLSVRKGATSFTFGA